MVNPKTQQRAQLILDKLKDLYPDAVCSLTHDNPLQLLIATILSAQCTDERVNKITPPLFKRYKTAADFARANVKDLEKLIHSAGFYKNKAKNIKACCAQLVDLHKGQVPKTMEELNSLPGVGRKTANVVLGNAFGVPGMVVDTHVTRLSRRMGLANGKTAEQIEKDLEQVFKKEDWVEVAHLFIYHGRATCTARSPKCDDCDIAKHCPKLI